MYLIGGDFKINDWLVECFECLGNSNNVTPLQASENLSKLSLVEDKFIEVLTIETERRLMFELCENRPNLVPNIWMRLNCGKIALLTGVKQVPIMDISFKKTLDLEVSLKNLEEWRKKITVSVNDLEETLVLWLEQGILNEMLFTYTYSLIEERRYV